MTKLAASIHNLDPILRQLDPNLWIAKGSSGSYIKQLKSSLISMQLLVAATEKLAQAPESLPAALDAYFQMERVENLLGSLKDGIRRYQSSELADSLSLLLSDANNQRSKLQQHVQDLATTREQEFTVMDQEAQRCRGLSAQQPLDPKNERRRSHRRD